MKPTAKHRIVFTITASLVLMGIGCLSACGGGGGDSPRATGSVSFSVVMPDDGASNSLIAAAVDCGESGIATVEAEVLDDASNLLAAGGPWQCTQHSGKISGVEPGEDRVVLLLARDSEAEVNFAGTSKPFDVFAGQTASAGEITLLPESKPIARILFDYIFTDAGPIIAFNGAQSSDPDDDPLTYRWSILEKPEGSQATLSDPTAVDPTIAIDLFDIYVVRLVVNDGLLDSDPVDETIDTGVE
jgi:hypothetical protein